MQENQKTRVHALEMAVRLGRMIVRALTRHARQAVVACACLAGAASSALASLAPPATYYYDELGRLIETVAVDGTSVLYSYDAVGNITSVKHESVSSMGVSGFTPVSGSTGTVVTIYGSGFNTTAASNVVKFNGVSATVATASATALSVTVPSGATTGTVSVANGAANATSSLSFTVASSGAPTISSFTPAIGSQGTPVAIVGTNFQTTAATDNVAIGSVGAPVSTATATTLATVVPTPAASGKIRVTTPFGVATSAADFFDVPPAINVSDVQVTGRVTLGGTALTPATTAAGKTVLILFEGTAGAIGNYVQLTNVTAPGGSANVFDPDGNLLISGSVANVSIGLPTLPRTGTYMIALTPSAPTSMTVSVNPPISVTVDGASVNFTSPGQGYGAFVTFKGVAGQNLGLALSGVAITGGGHVTLNIVRPDGSQWPQSVSCGPSNPGGACGVALTNLPMSGTYLVQVINYYYGPITAGTVTLSSDKTATLTAASPYALSLRLGQNARMTFAGTAGQPATIRFANMVTTPDNQSVAVTIMKPDGTALSTTVSGSTSSNGAATYVPSLPVTGTYTVLAIPGYGAMTTMTIALNPTPDLVVDGAAVNISSSEYGFGTSLTFNGVAGQNLGLSLSGVAITGGGHLQVSVIGPDGAQLPQAVSCGPSNPGGACGLALTNLPMSGTYLVQVFNYYYGTITAGTATLSSDKTATLTAGSPYALSLRLGQNARLTFAGTAGQPATIRFANMVTTPDNQSVAVTIMKPDGTALSTTVSGSTSSNGADIYVPTLPVTGTYTVLAVPGYGAMTTMTIALNPTPDLVVDGAAVNISSSEYGFGTSLTFNGVAGQNLGLSLSGVAITGGGHLQVSVIGPDGAQLPQAVSCGPSNPGGACGLALTNLPMSGTYLVQVFNYYYGTITAGTATLSSDKTGTLAAGTAYSLSLRNGQNGRLTFTGTAASHSLVVGVPTTTPSGQAVAITVLDAGGNAVASGSYSTTGGTLALGTLSAGTYTVLVDPSYGAVTAVTLTYQ